MRSEIRHFFELLTAMTEKELRVRYKHTVFGFLWIIINPLLQMLMIGFVFRFFMKQTIEHYYHYLFAGLIVWNFFTLSLTKATTSVVFERSLIKKARFPRSVIPLSIILSNFIHMVLAQTLFLIPTAAIGTLSWQSVPYLLLAFLMLGMFTVGLSLLTSSLNVRYRDIQFIVQALLMVWFYASPIVYVLSIVPGRLHWIWGINPMTSVLQLFQHAYVGSPLPEAGTFTANAVLITAVFITGVWVFRSESQNFDDWL